MTAQPSPTNLREAIVATFSVSDLRALCMDLGVDAENLASPDATRPELVEAMLRDCLKRNTLAQFRQKLQTERPNLHDWPNLALPELALDTRDPYNVEGLANPFLGLRLFTYDDRASYTGRDQEIDEAVRKLTTPGEQQVTLWITGASGSGKSSFAQAGVIPTLERHYTQRNRAVRFAVFRPARHPMAMLKDALTQVGIQNIADVPARSTDPAITSDVILLVLDQFEEFFTQADDNERTECFAWLASLPTFEKCSLHILITIRADYLDELHEVDALWPLQQACSIPLHAMRAENLKQAIQRPLQVHFPGAEKRFEPALLEKLAQDAAAGPSLLPLLQVTLEELWKKGHLVLSAYGNLSDAITRRANQVLEYKDHERANPTDKRSPQERAAILDTFLSLVNVSLDDDPRRDVRIGRLKRDLINGAANEVLIDDLSSSRLLGTDADESGEVVNIVHESLIRDWDVLRDSVKQKRQQLQQRARFEQSREDWQHNQASQAQTDEYLLTGIWLAQAQELNRVNDVCMQSKAAKRFLQDSRYAAERQRTIVRRRRYVVVLTVITALAIGMGVAVWRWRDALARRVAFESVQVAATQPDLSLLLAEHASQDAVGESLEVRQDMLAGTQHVSEQLIAFLNGHTDRSWDVAFNHDQANPVLASVGDDGRLILWNLSTRQNMAELSAINRNTSLYSVAFSPDDKLLAAGDGDGNVILWSVETRQIIGNMSQHRANVLSIAFNKDGSRLVSGGSDGNVIVWDIASRDVITSIPVAHTNWVWSVAFSPDGRTVASGARDQTLRMWDYQPDPGTLTVTQVITDHNSIITSVTFAQVDGKTVLASGDNNGRLRLWDMSTWRINKQKPATLLNQPSAIDSTIWGLAFSDDGRKLLATGASSWMQVWQVDLTGTPNSQPLSKITPFIHGHSRSTMRGKFAPDGQTFATASFTGLVGLWQVGPGSAYVGHRGKVVAVYASGDGKQLRTVGEDGSVWEWDALAHTRTATATLQTTQPIKLARAVFDPSGKFVAGINNTLVQVWDNTGKLLFDSTSISTTAIYTDTINDVAFGPNNTLATGDANGRIVLWDLSSQTLKATQVTPAGQVYRVTFNANGQWLATGGCKSPNDAIRGGSCGRSEVRLWDANSLTPITQYDAVVPGKSGAVSALAFDASNVALAIGTQDGSVMVWDIPNRKERAYVNPLDGEITALAFTQTRAELAVATLRTRNILLYDLTNNQPIGAEFGEHRGRIDVLLYGDDGQSLYSASADGFAMRWDLDSRNWHARLCRTANRNLTSQEYFLYVDDFFYRKTCAQFP